MEFRDVFADEMGKEMDDLPMDKTLLESDRAKCQYRLSATITHLGNSSTQSGHYVADVYR